jgi:hypothetical protein
MGRCAGAASGPQPANRQQSGAHSAASARGPPRSAPAAEAAAPPSAGTRASVTGSCQSGRTRRRLHAAAPTPAAARSAPDSHPARASDVHVL